MKKELIFELSVYVLCILSVAFLWHKPFFLMTWYGRIGGCILWCLGIFKTLLFNPYMAAVFVGYYCLVYEKYL
jgi:hypothetical protein